MRFLVFLGAVVAIAWWLRRPDLRRAVIAMARSGAVYVSLARPDFATLQQQVLMGARRQRQVSVSGVTRLPAHYRVVFAESDRAVVEPIEAPFFADVASVLVNDAEARGWVIDGVPRFHADYLERGRPGLPNVIAGDAEVARALHSGERPSGSTPAPSPSSSSSREHSHAPMRTERFDPRAATEVRAPSRRLAEITLRELGTSRELTLGAHRDSVVIGRGAGVDVLVDHIAVSSRHAKLERSGDGWLLSDAESTNGTFLNDRAVAVPTLIRPGDAIRLGPAVSFLVSG